MFIKKCKIYMETFKNGRAHENMGEFTREGVEMALRNSIDNCAVFVAHYGEEAFKRGFRKLVETAKKHGIEVPTTYPHDGNIIE